MPRSMSEAFRNCLNEFKTLIDYVCKHRYIWSRLVLAQTALTNFCRLGYLRDIFTVLKGRGSNQGASWLGSGERPLSVLWKAVFLQCPLVWKEGRALASPSSCRDTNPIMELPLRTASKPHYLSEAPPPDTITLESRASACESGGYTDV